jgi:hypothetical protein
MERSETAGCLARNDQGCVDCLHDIRDRQVFLDQGGHRAQILADLAEEFLLASAEVVKPGLAVRCLGETMLRATTPARLLDLAFLAVARQ